jgi:ABC-type spermidine/putrescine transport system permease subunit I
MAGRWLWRLLALPGVFWLTLFFLVAFYAVLCVAFGNTNTLNELVPFWSPTQWNVGYAYEVMQNIWSGEQFLTAFLRTFAYVAIALAISLLIGYWPGSTSSRPTGGARSFCTTRRSTSSSSASACSRTRAAGSRGRRRR